MSLLARLSRLTTLAALVVMARGAWADVKVDVTQDASTKLWRYAYTIRLDDAIRAMGPGDVEEIVLDTRDLIGVDVPMMALLPEGWAINWEKDEDGKPTVVWANYDQQFELKPNGPALTFVLFSMRSPGASAVTLKDEADHEAKIQVQGPTGE
jgi:hypothetical protein